MARRRRSRPVRSRGSRGPGKSNWIAAIVNDAYTDVAAGVPADINLFVPQTNETAPQTVLRVVGSVWVMPQVSGNAVTGWIIYRERENAANVLPLNPFDLVDMDSDDIMLSRHSYFAGVGPGIMPSAQDAQVDVRSKRILVPNESRLVLTMACGVAWRFAANLRVLIKETAG